MKRNLLLLAVMMFTVFTGVAVAQDAGVKDTLAISVYPPDSCFAPPGPFFARIPIFITHDVTIPDTDNLAGVVAPICFTTNTTNPAAYCSMSAYWNAPSLAGASWPARSVFRSLGAMNTWMYDLYLVDPSLAWSTKIVNCRTKPGVDSSYFQMSLLASGPTDQRVETVAHAYTAVMTFNMNDSMVVSLDSCFWPPSSVLSFTRGDAGSIVPYFAAYSHDFYIIPNLPPVFTTCPGNDTRAKKGTGYQSAHFVAHDPDGKVDSVLATFAGTGVASVTVVFTTPPPAATVEGYVQYEVTNHCPPNGGTITLVAKDDKGAPNGQPCSFTITLTNDPPVATCPGNATFAYNVGFTGNATAKDTNDDAFWFSKVAGPPALTVDSTTGNIAWATGCGDVQSAPYTVTVRATDVCGATGDCNFTLTVTNAPPSFTTCADLATSISVGAIVDIPHAATDEAPATLVWSATASDPCVQILAVTATYTEVKATCAGSFSITTKATDACGLYAECTQHFTVSAGKDIAVRIGTIECGQDGHPAPGDVVCLPIEIKGNGQTVDTLSGFELEIDYDYTSMTFNGLDLHNNCGHDATFEASSFEKLTTRSLPCPNCGCCKYKIEILGIADMPGGVRQPGFKVPGDWTALVWLQFTINENENLRGLEIPVCWEFDSNTGGVNCGQNTFSDETGNTLYTSDLTCQYDSLKCTDPGAQRVIAFQPWGSNDTSDCSHICGGINICNVGQGVCKRGDVNDDGVPYTVADAVLFSKYFVDGLDVTFPDDGTRAYKVCATDVNADGRDLTLSDLVYLIRVILKDAPAIPMKLAPSSEVANVIVSNGTITTVCASPIGALLFEFDSAVNPTLLAANMEMENNGNKVLVWSRNGNSIQSATEVLSVGDAKLVSVTAVDRDSRELVTSVTAKVAPTTFALNPAYP
ncbi:MAG: putative Ig domain-containing protein, partial [Candidatus Zixiibacteriota bacterium]